MTYVNALEERRVFDALRAWLVRAGFSYRTLFWSTGGLAFVISPVADNLTTALVMCAVVDGLGRQSAPRFVVLSCINIVVAANAGGAFSPFGDITTLMVWQKGMVEFREFFGCSCRRLVNFLVPAALMHSAVPRGAPAPSDERGRREDRRAMRIASCSAPRSPPRSASTPSCTFRRSLGMMTGLGYLQLFDYHLQRRGRRRGRARRLYLRRVPPHGQRRVGHAAVLLWRDAVRRRAGAARLSVPDFARCSTAGSVRPPPMS